MFQVIVWDLPKMFYLHTNMQTFWDQAKLLKGTVQPKMKILYNILKNIQNVYGSSLEHRRYFEELFLFSEIQWDPNV